LEGHLRSSSQPGFFHQLFAAVLLCLSCGLASPAAAGQPKDDLIAAAKAEVSAATLPCSVVDARLVQPDFPHGASGRRGGRGGGDSRGGGDAAPRTAFIEVACQEGLGYLIVEPRAHRARKADPAVDATTVPTLTNAAPQFLNCLEADEASRRGELPARCELKLNADQRRGLQTLAVRVGLACDIQAARGLGHTEDYAFFEIACAKSPESIADHRDPDDYILVADRLLRADHAASTFSCFEAESNPHLKCEMAHVSDIVSALRRYVAKTQAGCTPSPSAWWGQPRRDKCSRSPARTRTTTSRCDVRRASSTT